MNHHQACNKNSFNADYFDGQSSRPRPASLCIEHGELLLSATDIEQRYPLAAIRISDRLGSTPRRIDLGDGCHCELAEGEALRLWLPRLGYRPSLALRLQAHWQGALSALLGFALIIWLAYGWGLPWAAARLAPHIPPAFTERLSQQALASLERNMLRPSALPLVRQTAIGARLQQLLSANDPGYRLLFRRTTGQANAFALPDGTLVVSDELIALAASNDEVVAVIAHELGHVSERHGLRQVIQASAVGIAVGLYFGDVSSLVGGLAALVGNARYSRDFEREADRFAALRLQRHGLSPQLLANMLGKLEQQHSGAGASLPTVLSSHPDTAERIRVLQPGH